MRKTFIENILAEIEHEAMTNKAIGRKQCEGMERAANIIRSHMDVSDINAGKWIPVEERLPEEDERVMISTKNEVVKEGTYTERYGYAMRKGFFTENCFEDLQGVTAWQPLPELYGEKK